MSVQYHIEDHAPVARARAYNGNLLHACIEAQAARAPHHTAFEFSGKPVTYLELDARANQVANYLIGKGIGAGDFVAFHQTRSADLYIGILGAMKAGAAYVAIDAATPAGRVAEIVAEFAPKLVLASASLAQTVAHADRLVVVEDERAAFASLPSHIHFAGTRAADADTIAQVIFKTAADGSVKALAASHSEAVLFMRSLVSVYGIEAHHRCFQDASVPLDVALEEVWAMLSAGATVVFADAKAAVGATFLADEQISFLSTVPESLATIAGDVRGIDIVVVGGAKCPTDLAVSWSLKARRLVSIKIAGDRVPSFTIEQDAGAWRPRMLYARGCERAAV